MSDRFLNQTGLAHLVSKLKTMISGKVDKEEGKTLSSNDFTDSYIDTIEDLSSSIEFNKTIYVDSVNGDDSNAGTSTSKYKTIEKALKEAIKYRTCIINLADGTYDTSAALDIRGSVSLSIRGSSADAVIINGRISAGRDAYAAFQNLTIQGETTTSNGSIFCWENAQIYTSGCNLIPTGGYCVYATTGGIVNLVSSTFGGTPTSTLRSQNGGTITAHGCTDNTGKSSSAVGSGRLYLNNCADMTYSNSANGMVFVNGIQVLPTQNFIDDSGVTAGTYGPTTSTEPNFGDTFTIGPIVTINEKGQITSAVNAEAKLPNYTATTSKAGLMSASDKISLSDATTKISQLGTYYRSIYVSSTTGNDENDGSNGSPVATMARVRELVNTYQNSLISITFMDNAEYSYDGTLTFYARNVRFTGTTTSDVTTTFTFSCSFEECNVSMSNIAFNYTGTSPNRAIQLNRGTELHMGNCSITTASTYCIQGTNNSYVSMNNCKLDSGTATYAIYLTDTSHADLVNITDNGCANIIRCGNNEHSFTTNNGQYPITYTKLVGSVVFIDGVIPNNISPGTIRLYVDAIDGDDSNTGYGEHIPLKSLETAILKGSEYEKCYIELGNSSSEIRTYTITKKAAKSIESMKALNLAGDPDYAATRCNLNIEYPIDCTGALYFENCSIDVSVARSVVDDQISGISVGNMNNRGMTANPVPYTTADPVVRADAIHFSNCAFNENDTTTKNSVFFARHELIGWGGVSGICLYKRTTLVAGTRLELYHVRTYDGSTVTLTSAIGKITIDEDYAVGRITKNFAIEMSDSTS